MGLLHSRVVHVHPCPHPQATIIHVCNSFSVHMLFRSVCIKHQRNFGSSLYYRDEAFILGNYCAAY